MIREIRWIFHFSRYSFSHLPRKSRSKERFLFFNQTKFFLAVKVKSNLNMILILFLLKQLCCCCLVLTEVSSCNSFQLYIRVFYFLCIDILRIVLQTVNLILNLHIIKNYIVASHVQYTDLVSNCDQSLIVFLVRFSFLSLMSIHHIANSW